MLDPANWRLVSVLVPDAGHYLENLSKQLTGTPGARHRPIKRPAGQVCGIGCLQRAKPTSAEREFVMELSFEVDDLVVDDLSVTVMRDAVALPEAGASGGSCCGGSSCCCCPNPM